MIAKAKGGGTRTQPQYVPSPEQIRTACAKIQAGWSPDMHYHRATGVLLSQAAERRGWKVPVVNVGELGLDGGAASRDE